MTWLDALGFLGASLTLCVYSMRRMIPLRIIGICANIVFIIYGLLGPIYPQLFLHGVLLPLNIYRLREMILLIGKVKAASRADLNMDWLKPHMKRRRAKRGEVLFSKGDISDALYYSVSGRYRLIEIDQEISAGQVIGEIGLIAPGNRRTLTVECIEDGDLLTVTYDHVKELYFQNPTFGFYFLELISQRLFKDIERLQEQVMARETQPVAMPASPTPSPG